MSSPDPLAKSPWETYAPLPARGSTPETPSKTPWEPAGPYPTTADSGTTFSTTTTVPATTLGPLAEPLPSKTPLPQHTTEEELGFMPSTWEVGQRSPAQARNLRVDVSVPADGTIVTIMPPFEVHGARVNNSTDQRVVFQSERGEKIFCDPGGGQGGLPARDQWTLFLNAAAANGGSCIVTLLSDDPGGSFVTGGFAGSSPTSSGVTGAAGYLPARVVVSTNTLLAAARPGRRAIRVYNTDTAVAVRVSGSATQSGTIGETLPPGGSLALAYTGALYATSEGANVTVSVGEVYD